MVAGNAGQFDLVVKFQVDDVRIFVGLVPEGASDDRACADLNFGTGTEVGDGGIADGTSP